MTGALKVLFESEPEVHKAIADTDCSKLHIQVGSQQSVSHSTRQAPRFLPIVATLGGDLRCLEKEWEGDIAALRYDIMKKYFGSSAGCGFS